MLSCAGCFAQVAPRCWASFPVPTNDARTTAMLRFALVVLGLSVAQTACSDAAPTSERTDRDDFLGAEPGIGTARGGGGQGGVATFAGAGWENAGTAGGAGQSIAFGPFGATCSDAQACSNDLRCFKAGGEDFGTFSPAGGYCTKLCSADSDCTTLDPTARCVSLFVGDGATQPQICAPVCTLGSASACGNRPDLACWPIEEAFGPTAKRACLPTCNHDDLCPAGTVCDGYVNLCSKTAPSGGQPLGSACNPAALNNLCAEGMCIELDGGGVCSGYCRRGTFPQCGDLSGEDSICGWVFPGDEDAGQADIGMCASTCACDSDCVPGTHCVLHADRAGMALPGLCTAGATTGIATCPN